MCIYVPSLATGVVATEQARPTFVVMATPEEAAIDKMKAFIAGGACGNELSVGLYDRLLEVAGRVPVTNLPSATNNTLTGNAVESHLRVQQRHHPPGGRRRHGRPLPSRCHL